MTTTTTTLTTTAETERRIEDRAEKLIAAISAHSYYTRAVVRAAGVLAEHVAGRTLPLRKMTEAGWEDYEAGELAEILNDAELIQAGCAKTLVLAQRNYDDAVRASQTV
jgi:hypothetical protein